MIKLMSIVGRNENGEIFNRPMGEFNRQKIVVPYSNVYY